jgi:hypothetical protein
MSNWTRQDFVRSWPDCPNPYSLSNEPLRNGQIVDESRMLDAIAAHEALMTRCTCDWDIDWEGRGVNTPPVAGCPVHNDDEENEDQLQK